MIGMSAVIFIPDDTAKTGYPQPLMLQSVMGAPLLAWLANALFDSGVGRFFLVCHDRYVEAARACLPAEAEVMTTMDSDPADLLHVFLSTAEDAEHTITVVTGPAVYLPQLAPQAAGRFPRVYGVSREELMQALDEHFSFARFLLDNGSPMNEAHGHKLGFRIFGGLHDLAHTAALVAAVHVKRRQLVRLAVVDLAAERLNDHLAQALGRAHDVRGTWRGQRMYRIC